MIDVITADTVEPEDLIDYQEVMHRVVSKEDGTDKIHLYLENLDYGDRYTVSFDPFESIALEG